MGTAPAPSLPAAAPATVPSSGPSPAGGGVVAGRAAVTYRPPYSRAAPHAYSSSMLTSTNLDRLASTVPAQHIRDVVDASLAVDWKPSKPRPPAPAEAKRAAERSLAEFREQVSVGGEGLSNG